MSVYLKGALLRVRLARVNLLSWVLDEVAELQMEPSTVTTCTRDHKVAILL